MLLDQVDISLQNHFLLLKIQGEQIIELYNCYSTENKEKYQLCNNIIKKGYDITDCNCISLDFSLESNIKHLVNQISEFRSSIDQLKTKIKDEFIWLNKQIGKLKIHSMNYRDIVQLSNKTLVVIFKNYGITGEKLRNLQDSKIKKKVTSS